MNEQTLNPAIANPTGQNASKPLEMPRRRCPPRPTPHQPRWNNPPLQITSSPPAVTEKRPISEHAWQPTAPMRKKSTGPRTPEGKQRSCMNATRHAILGQVLHLHRQRPDRVQRIHQQLSQDPATQRSRRNAACQHLRRSSIPSPLHSRRRTQPLRSRPRRKRRQHRNRPPRIARGFNLRRNPAPLERSHRDHHTV